MVEERESLRDRRRAETQRAVQREAMRLFAEQGYDATTVAQVAEAAGVSAMTVYRHFPTKEDLVLWDEYDRLVAEHIRAQPADAPTARRIGRALVEAARAIAGPAGHTPGNAPGGGPAGDGAFLLARLRLMVTTPALRARHWDSQFATQTAIVEALRDGPPDPERDFASWAAAGACQAAMNAALERWAAEDGRSDLPALIERGLAAAFGEAP